MMSSLLNPDEDDCELVIYNGAESWRFPGKMNLRPIGSRNRRYVNCPDHNFGIYKVFRTVRCVTTFLGETSHEEEKWIKLKFQRVIFFCPMVPGGTLLNHSWKK